MPLVPYKADLGYTQQSITTPERPDYTAAQALDSLSTGVARTARAVDEYNANLEHAQEQVRAYNVDSDARKASKNVLEKSLEQADPSGRDLQTVYAKNMEEMKKKYFASEKDPYVRAKMEQRWDTIDSQNYDTLLEKRLQMGKAWGENSTLEAKNKMVGDARMEPDKAMLFYKQYENLTANIGLSPQGMFSAHRAGKKEAAAAAVSGFIDGKNFEGARKAALVEFAGAFDGDELDKQLKKIEDARNAHITNMLKDDDNIDKRAAEQQIILQDRTFRKHLSMVKNLDAPDAVGESEQISRTAKMIDEDLAAGLINPPRARFLKTMLERQPVEDNYKLAETFYSRLITREDLDSLSDDVARAASTKDISTETALKIITEADKVKKELGRAGAMSKSGEMTKVALEAINNAFKPRFGEMSGEQAQQVYEAKRLFYDNMANPQFGGDPDLAFKDVMKKFGRGYAKSKALKLVEADTPKAMLNRAHTLWANGTIKDKKLYKEILLGIEQRVQEEEGMRARKDGKK